MRVKNEAGKELVASRDWELIAAALVPAVEASRVQEAEAASQLVTQGLEHELRYEFAWLERDLKRLRELGPLLATLAPQEAIRADAFALLKQWACDPNRTRTEAKARPEVALHPLPAAPSPEDLRKAAAAVKVELRKESQRFVTVLREVLDLRSDLLVLKDAYPGMHQDVAKLIGPQFLRTLPLTRFWELPRYLKAMKLRAERWKKNPQKDAERALQLAPYLKAPAAVRWLVEEFRVSLFAQELGTSEPVSAVKLDQAIAEAKGGAAVGKAAPSPTQVAPKADKPAPVVVRLESVDKGKPLKSLSGLDKFFSR